MIHIKHRRNSIGEVVVGELAFLKGTKKRKIVKIMDRELGIFLH